MRVFRKYMVKYIMTLREGGEQSANHYLSVILAPYHLYGVNSGQNPLPFSPLLDSSFRWNDISIKRAGCFVFLQPKDSQ